jgi:hypothetical protein
MVVHIRKEPVIDEFSLIGLGIDGGRVSNC